MLHNTGHKVATMDYIATLEHNNKMKDSRIEYLEKELEQIKSTNKSGRQDVEEN